jgi:hypothetical protein
MKSRQLVDHEDGGTLHLKVASRYHHQELVWRNGWYTVLLCPSKCCVHGQRKADSEMDKHVWAYEGLRYLVRLRHSFWKRARTIINST